MGGWNFSRLSFCDEIFSTTKHVIHVAKTICVLTCLAHAFDRREDGSKIYATLNWIHVVFLVSQIMGNTNLPHSIWPKTTPCHLVPMDVGGYCNGLSAHETKKV